MRKIICITGPDGSGKSTLIQSLLKEHNYYVASIWDGMKDNENAVLFNSKLHVDTYLCNLQPDARLLFLAHAMKISIDKALESNQDIIIDSYFYKYFASELTLGASQKLVNSLIELFVEPNITFYLDIDSNTTKKRKIKYSRYECGLAKIATTEAFYEFQQKVEKHWNTFIKSNWIKINAKENEEVVLKNVLTHL